ncbi:MAG: ATP-binding protein [Ornithinimicrobium sp.]
MTLNPLPSSRETVTRPNGPPQFVDFDFIANGAIDPATMYDFAKDGWLREGESLCLIGAGGTGKSHLLMTLGVLAVAQGYLVRYVVATRLIDETGCGARRQGAR